MLFAVLAALPVSAGPLEDARTAFSEGRFVEAAGMAETAGSVQGLALAAEALAMQAFYLAARPDRAALFERALRLAERAVAAGPDEAAAHIAAARVMGRHGQTLSVTEASERGYGEKIRDTLDRALALDPESLQARIGMALWHTQVVDAAGSFMARIVYGAREETAYELFEQAVARAPGARRPLFEYARALMVLDGDKDRARSLLRQALAAPARDALDRIVGERAAKLLAEFEAGG